MGELDRTDQLLLLQAYVRRRQWEADLQAAAIWRGFSGDGKAKPGQQQRPATRTVSPAEFMKIVRSKDGRA